MFEMFTRWPRRQWPRALLLCTAAPLALAQSAAPSVADQTNTMDAQIQILRKQAELHQALAQAAGTQLTSLPRVLAVFGFKDSLTARLLLAGGIVSNFKEGESVRSGMTLAAITPKAVLLNVGVGKRVRTVALDFVAGGNGTPAGAASPAMFAPPGAPLPPLPLELLPAPPAVNGGGAAALAR
jgi:type IV pilus biogenesis protein PilP